MPKNSPLTHTRIRNLSLVAGIVLLAACGGGDYGRDDAIEDLESGGLTGEQAVCVADGLESAEIDYDEANESEEGSETFQELVDLAADCVAQFPEEGGDEDNSSSTSEGEGGSDSDSGDESGD